MKNPGVDTSFLPDREREMKEFKEREQLRMKWQTEQDKIKAEKITITYSYWDGSGHRRDMKMNKGATIEMFLQSALRVRCAVLLGGAAADSPWIEYRGCACTRERTAQGCTARQAALSACLGSSVRSIPRPAATRSAAKSVAMP